MRLTSILLAALLVAAAGIVATAAGSPTTVTPGQEQWKAQQGNFDMAVLYGDPSAKGEFYVVRLKLPANWSFPPHTHPTRENVTVISGTLYAGIGSAMDKTKVMAYPAGSFVSLPENLPHYAMTKDDGAVIQLDGTGPQVNNMIK